MTGYIFKRLISAIPVLLGISVIVFLIMAMIPGDPATAILGSYATPENVEKLNRDLGLDNPLVQRYFIWLGNMLQGDFGRSFALNRDVLDEVFERFSATLVLAGTSFIFCAFFGILAGVISASRQYSIVDKAITSAVLVVASSVPSSAVSDCMNANPVSGHTLSFTVGDNVMVNLKLCLTKWLGGYFLYLVLT